MAVRRILFLGLALVLIPAAACGSGDKETAPAADSGEPAASTTSTPEPADEGGGTGDSGGVDAVSEVFSTLFGGALSGPDLFAGDADLTQGDASLLAYVLSVDDLPAGFTPFGEFTYRLPDGISETGGMDMAASMAYSGDIESDMPSNGAMLMSMVLRPDDLTALGDMFESTGELSERDLQDALLQGTGGFPGFGFKDVEVLDVSGLGEGAFGMGLTMDLSGLADMFGELGDPSDAAELEEFPVISMRMYMFGRGDYAGAVMHMGFGAAGLSGVDSFALAKLLDAKLQSAP